MQGAWELAEGLFGELEGQALDQRPSAPRHDPQPPPTPSRAPSPHPTLDPTWTGGLASLFPAADLPWDLLNHPIGFPGTALDTHPSATPITPPAAAPAATGSVSAGRAGTSGRNANADHLSSNSNSVLNLLSRPAVAASDSSKSSSSAGYSSNNLHQAAPGAAIAGRHTRNASTASARISIPTVQGRSLAAHTGSGAEAGSPQSEASEGFAAVPNALAEAALEQSWKDLNTWLPDDLPGQSNSTGMPNFRHLIHYS